MIALGCDLAGLYLKNLIIGRLRDSGHDVLDVGCHLDESADYPIYAKKVADAVLNGGCEKGVAVCGTGIGMSMVLNRKEGIRCALCNDCYSAKMAREHNDANVLALGARVIGSGLAVEIVETFLSNTFSGEERHRRRIDMIDERT